MKKCFYICLEGSEGTGKTTQYKLVSEELEKLQYKVFKTKEPGTEHSPLTLELRKLALDSQYNDQMTIEAREYIMQAIRSIHLQKVVEPAKMSHDYIIQDRGQLSGLSYGLECGNTHRNMIDMISNITLDPSKQDLASLYDIIIILKGDVKKGLDRALSAKQEFEAGDAMEGKGLTFLDKVNQNFDNYSKLFNNVKVIDIEGKSKETVTQEILAFILELK